MMNFTIFLHSSALTVCCILLFVNSQAICDVIESLDTSSHEELLKLYRENACEGKPFCNSTAFPHKGLYKCMCDSNCSFYGDCCSDSPYYEISTNLRTNLSFSCSEEFRFYMIDSCPAEFTNTSVKLKCEHFSLDDGLVEDVNVTKPVMDTIKRITYSNVYCALCNGADNSEAFGLSYRCFNPNTYEFIQDVEYLVKVVAEAKFSPRMKRFFSTFNDTEYVCSPEVFIPARLKPHLRYCEPKLISSCPKTFNDSSITEKCETLNYAMYTSKIIGKGRVYKNEYCALCNGFLDTQNLQHCQTAKGRAALSNPWNESRSPSAHLNVCDDPRLRGRLC